MKMGFLSHNIRKKVKNHCFFMVPGLVCYYSVVIDDPNRIIDTPLLPKLPTFQQSHWPMSKMTNKGGATLGQNGAVDKVPVHLFRVEKWQ